MLGPTVSPPPEPPASVSLHGHPAVAASTRPRAPAPPAAPRRTGFPWLAATAPVLGALAIWAITRSPFALVFAALGPLIAVATTLDSRRNVRRETIAESSRFEREAGEYRSAIAAFHADERAALRSADPDAAAVVSGSAPLDSRWCDPADGIGLVLGRGDVRSALAADADHGSPSTIAGTGIVVDAPLVLRSPSVVGVQGDPELVRAYLRGLAVQIIHRIDPDAWSLIPPGTAEWEWASPLGQDGRGSPRELTVVIEDRTRRPCAGRSAATDPGRRAPSAATDAAHRAPDVIRLVGTDTEADLPATCPVVVRLGPRGTAALLGRSAPGVVETVAVESVSVQDAARIVRVADVERSTRAAESAIPTRVDLGGLLDSGPAAGGASGHPAPGLACPIGRDARGDVALDLVADGPHALVAGTTGSGKSELLVTWITAMAARHPPTAFTVLLVDFKGGAAFAPLRDLPHCAGLVTDLSPSETRRAFDSLAGEVLRRERLLADHSAPDIRDLPPGSLPRLVIVIDELASLVSDAPELHGLLADLTARGRSLGIHLILCTQRPSGVVRDAALANCGLRISLRVHDETDSRSVVGTTDAARLPPDAPGRAVVVRSGQVGIVQIAVTTPSVLRAVVAAGGGSADEARGRVVSPWLDPMPTQLRDPTAEAVAGPDGEHSVCVREVIDGGRPRPSSIGSPARRLVLGLVDVPEERRRPLLLHDLDEDGSLLVIGGPRSGTTTTISTLVHAASRVPATTVERLGDDLERLWDVITAVAAADAPGRGSRMSWSGPEGGGVEERLLLAIDDLDDVVRRLGPDHARSVLDSLLGILRRGRRTGCVVVASTHGTSDGIIGLLPAFDAVLRHRAAGRTDHLVSGGDAARYDPRLPAGAGLLGDRRVQIVLPPVETEAMIVDRPPVLDARRLRAVVSTRPRALRTRLEGIARLVPPSALAASSGAGGGGDTSDPRENTEVVIEAGTPDEWQSAWSRWTERSTGGDVLLDGLSGAEFRLLTRSRELPPYCDPAGMTALVRDADARLIRVSWPEPDHRRASIRRRPA